MFWIAFVIILTTSGQIQAAASPEPYASKEECVAKNLEVETKAFKSAGGVGNEIVGYHFDCVEVTKETFKKPGIDA